MSSYRPRFERLLRDLEAHPEVEVYNFAVEPPATEAKLREAERFLGVPLPPAMRAFYSELNGFFVEWAPRGDEHGELTSPFGYPEYGQPPGCINLLPIEEALSTAWQDEFHVNEIQPDHWQALFGRPQTDEEAEHLADRGACCIDNFSKYNHADLILGPEPLVVVSTDHGADMDSSDFMDFETYLELTLATWGLNRYKSAGIGWSRKSQRLQAFTERPDLQTIVQRMRADAP
ncbi:SMI1/KNR4 family protein [Myxococcota bacterium]|nr:SMI1/KNR4 family protein [Myxococcota bacterium]